MSGLKQSCSTLNKYVNVMLMLLTHFLCQNIYFLCFWHFMKKGVLGRAMGPVDVDFCKSVYHNTDELSNEIVRKNGTPIRFYYFQVNL